VLEPDRNVLKPPPGGQARDPVAVLLAEEQVARSRIDGEAAVERLARALGERNHRVRHA
jgi:hypothetical protein